MLRFLWLILAIVIAIGHWFFGLSGLKLDMAIMAVPFFAFANQFIIKGN